MGSGYKKHVQYHFDVEGEVMAISQWDTDYVFVEELRKNGQEDCHMSGVLVATTDGKFVWEEGEEMFARYHSQKLADGIRAYVTEHGVPGHGR